MNIDTDTQYAFTRPIAAHMFTNYDGVLKVDGEVGNKKAYDPRTYIKAAEAGMAERVAEACEDLSERRDRAWASDRGGRAAVAGRTAMARRMSLARQPARPRAHPAARRPGRRRAGRGRRPGEGRRRPPDVQRGWATLAEAALADGAPVTAYAYARTGYHRGLDQLRRAAGRAPGPCPGRTSPTRVPARAGRAAPGAPRAIGELDEAERYVRRSWPTPIRPPPPRSGWA